MNTNDKYVLQATYSNYNFGSVLQCFATQKYFESKGLKCYLVKKRESGIDRIRDYIIRRMEYLYLKYRYPDICEANQKQITSTNSSKNRISQNTKKLIDVFLSTQILSVQGANKKLKQMAESDKCEMCIAGSDQIWNSARVFVDKVYFLDFSPKNKRFAFAPSFGGDKLSDYNRNRYKKYISDFYKLSSREETGVSIIEELTSRKAELFLDPIFLLKPEEWDQIGNNSKLSFPSGYVFTFFLDNPSELAQRQINELKRRGYNILTIGYEYEHMNEYGCILLDGGPEDFISILRNATIVLTDSFHVTAFSILFHKDFYAFERSYTGTNQASRLTNILKETGLFYRYDYKERIGFELTTDEKNRIDSLIKENNKKVDLYFNLERGKLYEGCGKK